MSITVPNMPTTIKLLKNTPVPIQSLGSLHNALRKHNAFKLQGVPTAMWRKRDSEIME